MPKRNPWKEPPKALKLLIDGPGGVRLPVDGPGGMKKRRIMPIDRSLLTRGTGALSPRQFAPGGIKAQPFPLKAQQAAPVSEGGQLSRTPDTEPTPSTRRRGYDAWRSYMMALDQPHSWPGSDEETQPFGAFVDWYSKNRRRKLGV